MKITLNIETNDPADLERIAAALAGKEVAVTTGKLATPKKTETAVASGTATSSAGASPTDAGTQTSANGPSATTAASPSEGAVPSDQELVAAANVATGKLGAGGPDKVKTYIAANFKKADGSPGTLKTTAEGERAGLLDALQKIGRGEIAL